MYIYIYAHTYTVLYMYILICIEREREIRTYLYIYICTLEPGGLRAQDGAALREALLHGREALQDLPQRQESETADFHFSTIRKTSADVCLNVEVNNSLDLERMFVSTLKQNQRACNIITVRRE